VNDFYLRGAKYHEAGLDKRLNVFGRVYLSVLRCNVLFKRSLKLITALNLTSRRFQNRSSRR
jgi:hypothetical protein